MTNLEYQDGGKSSVQDFTTSDRVKPWQQRNFFYLNCAHTRKEHWTWSTKMAAMTGKFNFGCMIQYYSDQCLNYTATHGISLIRNLCTTCSKRLVIFVESSQYYEKMVILPQRCV